MLNRRNFLKGCALNGSLLGLAALPTWQTAFASMTTDQELFLSAFSRRNAELEQSHYFGLFDAHGKMIWEKALLDRAHAPVVHPTQSVIGIVARRPGYYIDFFEVVSGDRIARIEPTEKHHFYGHAIFNKTGDRLISQENHFSTGEGRIVIRSWPDANIIAEYKSNGIGPHESVLLDNNTLVIANGGLKTHPAHDRDVLNLDTMAPNVTYLSLEDGSVIQSADNGKDLHQLSIRHLDVNPQGIVALGFQYQGEKWDQVPLVGISSLNSDKIEHLPMPEEIRQRFKQYCGSVCFDKSGQLLAISTPRGNLVAYWNINERSFLGVNNCRDVCGVSQTDQVGAFMLTSGTGKQWLSAPLDSSFSQLNHNVDVSWDNHLRQINLHRYG
ncbi:DUF1513 domain-containing protein [Marinomonas mediterranea]|uniref:DUF1513 domain-containing protein n=1 Tax=Marinomonas mediterranea TaxID=119864 RepID=UPI00234ABEFB|nr:DUF1513 domain-containing protein [Marinomonas mediterranea]WCN12923.1 DUF1513 domain-containing protein [Marinomonas mediterranea]